MKKQHKLLSIMLAGGLLTACSSEEPAVGNGANPLRVTADIESVRSRAAGTSWAVGDKIGITTTGNTKEYVNMEYTVDDVDAGTFTGNPIYFQKNGVDVTFTAYYPFTGTEGTPAGVAGEIKGSTVETNQTFAMQPTIDYLWAEGTGSRTDPDVNFIFTHRMSKISLTFKSGDDTDINDISAYTLEGGFAIDGTFNVNNGIAKPDYSGYNLGGVAGSLNSITITKTAEEFNQSVILYPQTLVNNVTLSVVLGGETYKCVLPVRDNKLLAGNNYNFTVRIDKTGMTVVGSEITDWIPVDNEGEIGAEMPK